VLSQKMESLTLAKRSLVYDPSLTVIEKSEKVSGVTKLRVMGGLEQSPCTILLNATFVGICSNFRVVPSFQVIPKQVLAENSDKCLHFVPIRIRLGILDKNASSDSNPRIQKMNKISRNLIYELGRYNPTGLF
jgi:hypothetical protein